MQERAARHRNLIIERFSANMRTTHVDALIFAFSSERIISAVCESIEYSVFTVYIVLYRDRDRVREKVGETNERGVPQRAIPDGAGDELSYTEGGFRISRGQPGVEDLSRV